MTPEKLEAFAEHCRRAGGLAWADKALARSLDAWVVAAYGARAWWLFGFVSPWRVDLLREKLDVWDENLKWGYGT